MNPKRSSAAHHMFRSIMAMVLVLVMVAGNSFVITAGAAGDKPAQEPKQTFEIEIGETITLPVYDDMTTFESSDEAVASVTQNGDVTGIGAGTATVTVTSTKGRHGIKFWEWGKKLITVFEIIVKEPYVEPEPVQGETYHIKVGEILQLSVDGANVRWESSDKHIARVSRTGVVRGNQVGTAIVTATYTLSSGAHQDGNHGKDAHEIEAIIEFTIIVEASEDPEPAPEPTEPPKPSEQPHKPKKEEDRYPEKPENPTEADEYYWSTSTVVEVIDVSTSKDVQSEREVAHMLEERGFSSESITYNYSIDGGFGDDTEVNTSSSIKHPMYETSYITSDGNWWYIYVINGEIYGNPLFYNLTSTRETLTIFSESSEVISYDDQTDKFYRTIPYESTLIVKQVHIIDAETLDKLTAEEIDRL